MLKTLKAARMETSQWVAVYPLELLWLYWSWTYRMKIPWRWFRRTRTVIIFLDILHARIAAAKNLIRVAGLLAKTIW